MTSSVQSELDRTVVACCSWQFQVAPSLQQWVGDENGFQAMKMAFKDFLNKIIVSIWCQET